MAAPDSGLRPSFPALEDPATSAGVPATKTVEGDALSGKVGQTVWSFIDVNGNVVHPQLDPQGRLPVSTEPQGTRMRKPALSTDAASVAGSTSAMQAIQTLSLVAGKKYVDIKVLVSCRRSALFQLIYKTGSTVTVLSEAIVESGAYNAYLGFQGGDEFDVPGGDATPAFIVQGQNYDLAATLHGSISCTELA